ncbi:MAG: adenine phosphoribosyltransferase [Pseudomonadota bacterium]
MDLKQHIRTIPDYPKPGIQFRDVTTLFGDPDAFAHAVDALAAPFEGKPIHKVAGIEARGFILGGAVARRLSIGFVPIRKKGKLPHRTLSEAYELEYGVDEVEIHADAVAEGQSVLLIDDLIATGGTAGAAVALLRRAGANIVGCAFVIDLPDLGGLGKLKADGLSATALLSYEGA